MNYKISYDTWDKEELKAIKDVIKTADYIVDMGPEGGVKGGHIVAEGKPEEICNIPGSYNTNKFECNADGEMVPDRSHCPDEWRTDEAAVRTACIAATDIQGCIYQPRCSGSDDISAQCEALGYKPREGSENLTCGDPGIGATCTPTENICTGTMLDHNQGEKCEDQTLADCENFYIENRNGLKKIIKDEYKTFAISFKCVDADRILDALNK